MHVKPKFYLCGNKNKDCKAGKTKTGQDPPGGRPTTDSSFKQLVATVCRVCRSKSKESHKWICPACKKSEDATIESTSIDDTENEKAPRDLKHDGAGVRCDAESGGVERIGSGSSFWDSLYREENRQKTDRTF